MKNYNVSTQFSISTKPLPGGFLAFRTVKTTTREGVEPSVMVWEGVADHEPTPEDPCPHSDGFVLVPQNTLDTLAQKGWSYYEDKKEHWVFPSGVCETPYSSDLSTLVLVRVDGGAHMVFDEQDQPFPVAVFCDYIEWCIDNEHYDLDKAQEVLSKRDDIQGLTRKDIPFFNASEKRSKTLEFTWTPSIEAYRQAWKVCQELSTGYPSCRFPQAVGKLDLWGLVKAGAAKARTL